MFNIDNTFNHLGAQISTSYCSVTRGGYNETLVHQHAEIDWLHVGCINPAFLVETIVSIKTPNLYDSLCVPVHLILHRASASDKMFVCVHDFSINVQSWVLFLGLLNHFIEHVVEKEISFSVEQEDKIIRKVPAGVDTFQCLYYS